ncbi:MAG: bifunctional 2-polyprenyl-6-hydroxyphenol methylase/3-demethylubiquinol 3-O-methyltransferase UbiG [Gammaproteobacteria bacterium]
MDQEEIAKFTKLAASWWDTEGPLKTLHDLNPIRLQFIKDHAALNGKTVLDAGCGGGILSEALTKSGASVTAIDMDAAALEAAREHAKKSNINIDYRHQTIESLTSSHPHHFDVITCMEMLEHVPDPAAIIGACAALLKPTGKLFVSTLNRHPKAYAMAVVGAEYILNLLPRGTHDYQKFIKPSELSNWARQHKLDMMAISGVNYQPFSRQCELTSDVKVNYMVCFGKLS